MPDALKNVYSIDYISRLADITHNHIKSFDKRLFINTILDNSMWPQLSLKQRMRHISQTLYSHIGLPYEQAIEYLIPISTYFAEGDQGGYSALFFPDIVECYGLPYFDTSMIALEHFTQGSSGEFAIRQFIINQPDKTMQQMLHWTENNNHFIRRLASEGCRPRLPWGEALPNFKRDPSPILPILDRLKQDPSLFVRRSVANNLNDIAKDNPYIVIAISQQWLGQHKDTDWIIKHGNRSLLKQANPASLALFDYPEPNHVQITNVKHPPTVKIGKTFSFRFSLQSLNNLGKLRVEFKLYFQKANGVQRPKVFSIGDHVYDMKRKDFEKSFSFKAISTRNYYLGDHAIEILVNGQSFYRGDFALIQ